MSLIYRPATGNFGYYQMYVDKAPEGDLLTSLTTSLEAAMELGKKLDGEEWSYRYAEGKWSIKEMYAHMCDTERNFSYRIMRFSRGDQSPLPPYNIHDYVINSGAELRSPNDIMAELRHLREATLLSFEGMTDEMLELQGPARDVLVSVKAIGFIMAGHMMHHLAVIREKYLQDDTI